MKDLEKYIHDKTSEIIASGAIEKKIEEAILSGLNKSVEAAVTDVFRSYSDFTKKLEKLISDNIGLNLEEAEIPKYNDMVIKLVRKYLNENLEEIASKGISERMEKILAMPPKRLKISQMAANFAEKVSEEAQYSGSFTFIIEKRTSHYSSFSSDWYDIYMDEEANKPKDKCLIKFSLSEKVGSIYSLRIGQDAMHKKLFLGDFYNFEKDLINIYAAGTIIEIDCEEVETYFEKECEC